MQTMHPVIVSGRHVVDTALFPGDEFEERLRQTRQLMDTHRLDGLVVYGNGEHSAALTYLTNLAPRMRWALAFVPCQGDIELVVAGPERDLHFSHATSWVKNLTAYDKLDLVVRRWADALRAAVGHDSLRVGFAGGEHVRQCVLDDVAQCLGQQADAWVDFDAELDQQMERLRPRQVRAIRNNLAGLGATVTVAREVVSSGGKAADAARAAEKAGLLYGAHEVRTLFSRDGGMTLQPFERIEPESSSVFAGYIARRELGHWAEAFVSHNVTPTQAQEIIDALSRMVAAAKDGALVGDIEQLRGTRLPGAKQHPFAARAVAMLGLAIQEKAPNDKLQAGGIYSMRAGLIFEEQTAAIGSVVVLVNDSSAEILLESHPVAIRS